jgi:hypothetical protein
MSGSDAQTISAALLIVGPLLGVVPVGNPALIPVWRMSREDHIRTVATHRQAWAMLNLGFGLATVLTASGLAILALAADPASVRAAGLTLAFVAYALGGALWTAVLAIRTRTTPVLGDMVADGAGPGPAEALVGAATTGMFDGFVVATSAALIALGVTMLVAGGVAAPVAGVVALGGVGGLAWLAIAGDVIPAALYLPTLLLGIALLAGWT